MAKIGKSAVVVTYGDSIKAGNCQAGTSAFQRRHNLPASGVAIKNLLKLVPATIAEARQIRAACLAAIRRQTQAA